MAGSWAAAAQGLQGHVDTGQQHPALVVPPGGDDADGGGGAHVDGDDGGLELLQGRHRVRHDVRPHLGLDRQPDVQPRPHAGATTMGGLPSSRVRAFSIMKFSGGTTLHRMAPVTSVYR